MPASAPSGAPPPRASPFLPTPSPAGAARYMPPGSFAGYASLFDTPDLGGDVIARGAFLDSLTRRGAVGVKLLYQHDAARPLGVWRTLREDSRGLYAEGQLALDNSLARDVWALLVAGAIDGLSIGFRTAATAGRGRPGGLRRLTRLDLWEISIVTFPMLPGARIGTIKSGPPPTPLRAAELHRLAATIRANI